MENRDIVNAYILSGGKSSRMGGEPKGLKLLFGKPMIQYTLDVCTFHCQKTTIIGHSESYSHFGYEVIQDFPDVAQSGPISGIYTAIKHSTSDFNLVVGCDMPFIPLDLISEILRQKEEREIVIPIHGDKLEPLCALYKSDIKDGVLDCIRAGTFKISDVISQFNVLYYNVDHLVNIWPKCFFNVNSPQDFEEAEKFLALD
ncbi:MAG: molybdenum cofactor guanylyltransferase [Saprospiraceae bacterium]